MLFMAIKDPRIVRVAKIELIGGQAKPGPALASVGINMADFTRQFNEKTKEQNGQVIPCVIYAYKDKSFKYEIKTTPAAILLKKAAKIERGGKNQLTDHVATISKEDALEIAKYKLPDLNANDVDAALRMIAGTAKQMGIKITDVDLTPKKNKGVH
ncbi:MAG: 50S ribosomal protein L11 [Mycoplasmoidaceae bacterium]